MTVQQTPEDAIRLLLVTAAQHALVDLPEKFRAVHFDSDNVLISVLTTLTRLKMLEALVLKAAGETLPIPYRELGIIAHDTGLNAVVQMVAAGSLNPVAAKALYAKYAVDEVFDKAAAGPPKDEKAYRKATADLDEALTKIRERRRN